MKIRRNNKYHAVKVEYQGMTFDSHRELIRWQELCLAQKIGRISSLERQVKFELIPALKGERAVSYYADFTYFNNENGKKIVEDVKSPITAKEKSYVIKRKLLKWRYPDIVFIEIF